MGSKVWQSAVTSDNHRKSDFWGLDWHNEAVTYQSSSLSDASSRLPVYCCIVQPSPPLHLSVYLPHAVLLILLCWFSFSLCGAFVLSRRFIPWKPRGSCITTGASSWHGCGKSRVNSDRPDLSLIWQQCKGTSVFSVNVAEQRRYGLRQYFCSYKKTAHHQWNEVPSSFVSHKAEKLTHCYRWLVIERESSRQSWE